MKLDQCNDNLVKFFQLSVLSTVAFLLCTDNYSVATAAITAICALYFVIKYKKEFNWDSNDKLVALCFFSYCISNIPLIILDWDNFRYWRGASRIALCFPIYLFLKYILKSTSFYIKPIILGTILGSVGAFSLASYQFFIEGRDRVDGFLFSINFGYLACTLAILSLTLLTHKKHRLWLVLSFALAISAMLMTLTRGAILALPIVMTGIFIFNANKIGKAKSIIFFVTLFSSSALLYSQAPKIQERVNFTISEFKSIASGDLDSALSSGNRLYLWKAAYLSFSERPVFGLTYPEREMLNKELYAEGSINEWASGVKRGHAHSQYFEQLASGGILGIFSLLMTLAFPFLYFFKYRNTSNAAFVGTYFVLGFSIFCLTEVALQQNLISTFYGYMLALFFAMTQLEVIQNQTVTVI